MLDKLERMLEEANSMPALDMEPLTVENRMGHDEALERQRVLDDQLLQASWNFKNNSSNGGSLAKPRRPLSAYNLYFQYEREKIITCNPNASFEETMIKIRNTPRPKKRRHRKSHGKIGFADLARIIADKWKALDSKGRAIFEEKAAEEKARYKEMLEDWRKASAEKAKQDEMKSPLELARVEVVYDDPAPCRATENTSITQQSKYVPSPSNPPSLSTLFRGTNAPLFNQLCNVSSSNGHGTEVRDYMKMTQQTIDMARASLSLPLFANLGGATGNQNAANSMLLMGHQNHHIPNGFEANLLNSQVSSMGPQVPASMGTQASSQWGGNTSCFPNNNLLQQGLGCDAMNQFPGQVGMSSFGGSSGGEPSLDLFNNLVTATNFPDSFHQHDFHATAFKDY